MLFRNDLFLLQAHASERSIAHKLGEYLQILFPDWNVDCEYNLKGLNQKILDGISECSEQKRTDRVFPDIIVHQRNKNVNLLVIEMKHGAEDPCDIEKLKRFTAVHGEFGYKSGLFIGFNSTIKLSLKWFEHGQKMTKQPVTRLSHAHHRRRMNG